MLFLWSGNVLHDLMMGWCSEKIAAKREKHVKKRDIRGFRVFGYVWGVVVFYDSLETHTTMFEF